MQPLSVDLAGTPPIESPAFWTRPDRVDASQDPDTATAQTIEIMCQQVKASAADEGRDSFADRQPMVQQTARGALQQFGGLAGDTGDGAAAVACAAWWWCKTFIKFVHHDFIIRQRLGETGHLQGLISPEVLVRMDRPEGDCAIFSECIAAFLTVFGVPYEFVTVAVNANEPDIFGHVYLYAVLPDGSRLPLDASHGQYPGWQVPSAHVSRRQVWDANGNPVPDHGSRFTGLGIYGLRGGLGAMVYDDQTGLYYDDGTGTGTGTSYVAPSLPADASGYFQVAGAGQQAAVSTPSTPGQFVDSTTGTVYTGSTYSAPAQNSAQWASFATALTKAGLTLAEINAIQPGTVVSANGAILRQNPGYAVGTSATTTGTLNIGGLSTSTLVIAALVIGGVLLMSKGGR